MSPFQIRLEVKFALDTIQIFLFLLPPIIYLIAGEGAGSKYDKTEELDVEILNANTSFGHLSKNL